MTRCPVETTAVNTVPIWKRYSLTIDQAAQYFGIGEKKLRQIIADDPGANYLLHNGVKVLFKKDKFTEYLNNVNCI